MSKNYSLLAVILLTAFVAACQPNPTLINSTVQPRDNRQTTSHNEMNRSATNGNSANHETANPATMNSTDANSGMSNANSTNQQEIKRESRTNSGE